MYKIYIFIIFLNIDINIAIFLRHHKISSLVSTPTTTTVYAFFFFFGVWPNFNKLKTLRSVVVLVDMPAVPSTQVQN